MALPTGPKSFRFQSTDLPSQPFESSRNNEPSEEDDEFVLSVELPSVEPEEFSVSWDDVPNIAAEHEDDRRGGRRTYHRRFRFPKTVECADVEAVCREAPRSPSASTSRRRRPASRRPSTTSR